MSKKSRAKSAPAKKPVNPVVAKVTALFAVVVFAGLPILMGIYLLAMALGGFLYNHQGQLEIPPFVRSLYGFDLPPQAKTLIEQGIPEDVVTAYKMYGDAQYELDTPVMAIAQTAKPATVKVIMGKVSAVRGAWRGSNAALVFSGGATVSGATTRTDEWKDSITGRVMDVYPWAAYQVQFDEAALHTYSEAKVSLTVTYAKQMEDSRDWKRETVLFERPVRFYVLSAEELQALRKNMPTPDNIRLPLMNPLNPVFWGLILVGSGIWILRSLRQQRP